MRAFLLSVCQVHTTCKCCRQKACIMQCLITDHRSKTSTWLVTSPLALCKKARVMVSSTPSVSPRTSSLPAAFGVNVLRHLMVLFQHLYWNAGERYALFDGTAMLNQLYSGVLASKCRREGAPQQPVAFIATIHPSANIQPF